MTIHDIAIYRRLDATWSAQHPDRQAKLSEMQLHQVKLRATQNQQTRPQSTPILPCKYTQYRDCLDDLDEEEAREL
jgi:gentisate 1,2-dioxygenase